MNILKAFSIFCAYCYVGLGLSNAEDSSKSVDCAASVSALPPDPSTNCCGHYGLDPSRDVVRGIVSKIDQHPWVALIEYERNNITKVFCHGTLISGKYILTAAHCVVGAILKSGTPAYVRLGEYDTINDGPDCVKVDNGGEDCTAGEKRIPIDKLIPHLEYNSQKLLNDIALIRMTEIVPYTDFIHQICLPTLDITLNPSTANFYKSGWPVFFGESKVAAIKRLATVPLVPLKECEAALNQSRITLWKGHLCAGGNYSYDFCKADSGAPLMSKNGGLYELAGIVSAGHKPCSQEIPVIYTKVYEYMDWIRSNIVP